jgi:hypothetical protein
LISRVWFAIRYDHNSASRSRICSATVDRPESDSAIHYVDIDSIAKATQSNAGSVQVAMPDFPLGAIQVMQVSRQPVLLVSVEQFAHQRPHAVLTI